MAPVSKVKKERETLFKGLHAHPHTLLGLQSPHLIRLYRPGAKTVHIDLFGKNVEAKRVDERGLFEVKSEKPVTFRDYRVYHQSGLLAHDPYAFLPTLPELDQYLFGQGVHYGLYQTMGARLIEHEGIQGVRFTVWAPNAKRVSVVADFNHFDGRANPMRKLAQTGLWELFIPGLTDGEKYKFELITPKGKLQIKADPYALHFEKRPKTASIVCDVNRYEWNDQAWMERRIFEAKTPKPLNIYEVHLGSWKKGLNYRQLAKELAKYCKEMGYTHVELLPILEHPLDESWGYQVTGYFAPTSRFGTPEDFQWFVDHLHQEEIGVILDWVPAHFPTDEFSLGRFDGTALYEHEDPKQGFHPHWSTYIFNYGRYEVANFLIASALFWLDVMHLDGLRVDAVASMLYLDYGREPGQWIPNKYGGKENLEAIDFFKHLNSIVHQKFPGTLMIAEESTSFSGISHPIERGGFGFDLKWNMGWMHDSLRYLSKEIPERTLQHEDLTFGILYTFSENFLLPFSHDEVVHEKKSLLSKMPGDRRQQFANLRMLLSYMICHPGKKLIFMGGDLGQRTEWNCLSELEWSLLNEPDHNKLHTMVKELNHLYLKTPSLWEMDFDPSGFEWVDFSDKKNSVISYLRKSSVGQVLCVHHFQDKICKDYFIKHANITEAYELFNSDESRYGGSGVKNTMPNISEEGITLTLPPLSTLILHIV